MRQPRPGGEQAPANLVLEFVHYLELNGRPKRILNRDFLPVAREGGTVQVNAVVSDICVMVTWRP